METKRLEEKFLDYIEGKLQPKDALAFEEALAQDLALKASFEAYKRIMDTEISISEKNFSLDDNFVRGVMQKVQPKKIGFLRRCIMAVNIKPKLALGGAATFATLLLSVYLGIQLLGTDASIKFAAIGGAVDVVSGPLGDATEDTKAKDLNYRDDIGPHVAEELPQSEAEKRIAENMKRILERKAENELLAISPGNSAIKPGDSKDSAVYEAVPRSKPIAPAVANVQALSSLPLGSEGNKNLVGKMKLGEVQLDVLSDGRMLPREKSDKEGARFREFSALGAGSLVGDLDEQCYDSRCLPPPGVVWNPPKPSNTEQYLPWTENPRTFVREEPVSTFSIDVDTASYANARRFLNAGNLPPNDSVRVEEFINYFDYQYPVQHEKPFTVSYEIAPSPLDKERHLLKVGIKAKDAATSEKPWNLVFLVDVSGSMNQDNKLPLVKRSLRLLVEKMRSGDRIAIVTYAGHAGLVLDSIGIDGKERILNAIETLSPGGSTHGSAGIHLAYNIAEKNRISGGVNRVILSTDGDFNVGTTSHAELINLIEEKRKSGVTLTTLGFGDGNLKDGMMEQLANKGNGNYFYIDSFKEARKVMETDLVGNMEVVAKDVKLQIEFNPKHVMQYRLIGYDNRRLRKEDFNNDKIDAGEIGSSHTVTAIYEVVLAGSELSKNIKSESRYQKPLEEEKVEDVKGFEGELAFLKIRFKEPDGESSKLLEFPIESSKIKSDSSATSDDFRFASAVAYFGTLLRGSEFAGNYTYKEIAELAAKAKGEDRLGYRQEFIELVKNAQSIGRGR